MRGNGFKLKEGRFRCLDGCQGKFFTQSGEVLEQTAQRGCGGGEDQVGWSTRSGGWRPCLWQGAGT